MPELTDDELEQVRETARHEGRMEREHEWRELENTRRLTELETRLDNLTAEVVTPEAAPAPTPDPVPEAAPEPEQQEEAAAEEPARVQAPAEPEEAPAKQKPKFRIL